jgi:hypothetical protein
MGIGDWGLGIGVLGQKPPIPNPQSPIPNPHLIKLFDLKLILYFNYFVI